MIEMPVPTIRPILLTFICLHEKYARLRATARAFSQHSYASGERQPWFV